jgi:hypothetical protein
MHFLRWQKLGNVFELWSSMFFYIFNLAAIMENTPELEFLNNPEGLGSE